MKKLLTFILALTFIFSLTACKDKEPEQNPGGNTVNIESAAKEGMITEIDYKLGDDVDSTKKAMQAILNDEGESAYFEIEMGDYTVMTAGSVKCCYKTADKSVGLTHIVGLEDAFGFLDDTMITTAKSTLTGMGYEVKERDARDGEFFFLPNGEYTVLEYKVEDNTVLFVFTNGELCATVIRK